jgi:hypothetical protein
MAEDFNIRVVTTADTSGIRQTSAELAKLQQQQEAQNKAAQQAAQQTGAFVGQLVGRLAGIGLIYQGLSNIKEVTAEVLKISDELDKQGELLVKHAQGYALAAKSVTDEAGVLHIAEAALKDMDAIQAKIHGTIQQEVSTTGKWVDSFGHLVQLVRSFGTAAKEEGRINQMAIAAKLEGELQNAKAADDNARRAIANAEDLKDKFDELKKLPYAEAVEKVNVELEKAREKQHGLNKASADYVKNYVDAGQQIQGQLKLLDALSRVETQRAAAAKQQQRAQQEAQSFTVNAIKTADQGAQRVLMNEEAARVARAEGREKDADMYEKSARQFEKGLTPGAREELESLRKAQGGTEPIAGGRKAGFGESQEAVNAMEKNRLAFEEMQKHGLVSPEIEAQVKLNKENFERQMRGEAPIKSLGEKTAAGGSGNPVVDAINQLKNDLLSVWR